MNRKDEHLQLAQLSQATTNCFDDMHILHSSIPKYNIEDIDISTAFANSNFKNCFYINAITGGSEKAHIINERLAYIAHKCDLLFATGSYSIAVKEPKWQKSFNFIKQKYPNLLLSTNIGADKELTYALQAVHNTKANFLQVHLNTLQELLMTEGDHNFQLWESHIIDILENINVPIIIKEVGFGMNRDTFKHLIHLGVKTVDLSGKGGTNFAYIENQRNDHPSNYLNDWGNSTIISLLESKKYQNQLEILASGGIRNALDIVKCLILGAKAVGFSYWILKLIDEYSDEEIIKKIEQLKVDIKKIMVLLNAKTIMDLKNAHYYFSGDTYYYLQQLGATI